MISLLRAVCTLGGLAATFMGAFYLFDGQYNTGCWALLAGVLLLFVGITLTEIDIPDDNDRDKYA